MNSDKRYDDPLTFLTDSYKCSHGRVLPSDTRSIYSYYESRGGPFPETVFFGLQYLLKTVLSRKLTYEDVIDATYEWDAHFKGPIFDKDEFLSMIDLCHGKLPVRICAVPEGTVVPTSNVLMTVQNTHPRFPWVTNWLETILCHVWYPSTVATLDREVAKIILRHLKTTGTPELLPWKLHDFGFRGCTCIEQAAIGGGAHLLNFRGTDTMPGMRFAQRYYGASRPAGDSIPASEHSVMTAGGGPEFEEEAFARMIETYGNNPSGYYAIVSDSYDIHRAVKTIVGRNLNAKIMEANCTLGIRPDSGTPSEIVLEVAEMLGESFGFSVNGKGFKVLHPKVRIVQGDKVEWQNEFRSHTVEQVLSNLAVKGWSADNVATFGSGGALLQKMNRDTFNFAFKCSARETKKHEWIDVWKSPSGSSWKSSKRGRLALANGNSGLTTVKAEDTPDNADHLDVVYEDGELRSDQMFSDISKRCALQ